MGCVCCSFSTMNDCCYYDPKSSSLFIKGMYREAGDNKIIYPIPRWKKRNLSKFFMSIGQHVNLKHGFTVHVVDKLPPADDTWIKIQLHVNEDGTNTGIYYYNSRETVDIN